MKKLNLRSAIFGSVIAFAFLLVVFLVFLKSGNFVIVSKQILNSQSTYGGNSPSIPRYPPPVRGADGGARISQQEMNELIQFNAGTDTGFSYDQIAMWRLDKSIMKDAIAKKKHINGNLKFYLSSIVAYYYSEQPLILDAKTDVYMPVIHVIDSKEGSKSVFYGGAGYIIGFSAYTYKDWRGRNLSPPEFDLIYEVVDANGVPIQVNGLPVVDSTIGKQSIRTTASASELGLNALWWIIPSGLTDAPDCVGSSERKIKVSIGIKGDLTSSNNTINGSLIATESGLFECLPDLRNHMVQLYRKKDGSYYTSSDELERQMMNRDMSNRDLPFSEEWVTPEEAEAIMGKAILPLTELPTGQKYYDAYRQPISEWDIDPRDMAGVTPDMSWTDAENTITMNKIGRETGINIDREREKEEREKSMWYKLFSGGYNPALYLQ